MSCEICQICRNCGSKNVVPIRYGLQSSKTKGEKEEDIAEGGCVYDAKLSPHYMCRKCHATWR
jgi:ribosomal protein L40E